MIHELIKFLFDMFTGLKNIWPSSDLLRTLKPSNFVMFEEKTTSMAGRHTLNDFFLDLVNDWFFGRFKNIQSFVVFFFIDGVFIEIGVLVMVFILDSGQFVFGVPVKGKEWWRLLRIVFFGRPNFFGFGLVDGAHLSLLSLE